MGSEQLVALQGQGRGVGRGAGEGHGPPSAAPGLTSWHLPVDRSSAAAASRRGKTRRQGGARRSLGRDGRSSLTPCRRSSFIDAQPSPPPRVLLNQQLLLFVSLL